MPEAGGQLMLSFKYEVFQDYYSISFKIINNAVQIRIFPYQWQQLWCVTHISGVPSFCSKQVCLEGQFPWLKKLFGCWLAKSCCQAPWNKVCRCRISIVVRISGLILNAVFTSTSLNDRDIPSSSRKFSRSFLHAQTD